MNKLDASFSISGLAFGTQEDKIRLSTANREIGVADPWSKIRAVRFFILARCHDKAVETLIEPGGVMYTLAEKWNSWKNISIGESLPAREIPETLFSVVALVHCIEPRKLSRHCVVTAFIAWACWLGGWIAECQNTEWVKGVNLLPIAAPLYQKCRSIIDDGVEHPCAPLSSYKLALAEAGALLRMEVGTAATGRARNLLRLVSEDKCMEKRDEDYFLALEMASTTLQRLTKFQSESKLDSPSINDGTEKIPEDQLISGPTTAYHLDDGTSMPLGEALMWSIVNPFSPACTGRRIFQ